MIGVPFVMMMFAILELGLIFVLYSVLENATLETGRLIRTGQAAQQGMTTDTAFKTAMCSRMSIFRADCMTRATVDVREVPDFEAPGDPISGKIFDKGSLGYSNGQPGSLMLVRVWYSQPLLTTYLAQGLSRMGDGASLLTTTTAFRNEPCCAAAPAPAPVP